MGSKGEGWGGQGLGPARETEGEEWEGMKGGEGRASWKGGKECKRAEGGEGREGHDAREEETGEGSGEWR